MHNTDVTKPFLGAASGEPISSRDRRSEMRRSPQEQAMRPLQPEQAFASTWENAYDQMAAGQGDAQQEQPPDTSNSNGDGDGDGDCSQAGQRLQKELDFAMKWSDTWTRTVEGPRDEVRLNDGRFYIATKGEPRGEAGRKKATSWEDDGDQWTALLARQVKVLERTQHIDYDPSLLPSSSAPISSARLPGGPTRAALGFLAAGDDLVSPPMAQQNTQQKIHQRRERKKRSAFAEKQKGPLLPKMRRKQEVRVPKRIQRYDLELERFCWEWDVNPEEDWRKGLPLTWSDDENDDDQGGVSY